MNTQHLNRLRWQTAWPYSFLFSLDVAHTQTHTTTSYYRLALWRRAEVVTSLVWFFSPSLPPLFTRFSIVVWQKCVNRFIRTTTSSPSSAAASFSTSLLLVVVIVFSSCLRL